LGDRRERLQREAQGNDDRHDDMEQIDAEA
jgi:hypothetical protein